jgi:hypothetical protein
MLNPTLSSCFVKPGRRPPPGPVVQKPDFNLFNPDTYDLEVRLAGTETVALDVPGLALADGTVYTVFAMGLAGGEPALTAVPSVDKAAPTMLPETGGLPLSRLYVPLALVLGALFVLSGLMLRARAVRSR